LRKFIFLLILYSTTTIPSNPKNLKTKKKGQAPIGQNCKWSKW